MHINCETWVRSHFEAKKEEVDELNQKVSFGGQETSPIRQLQASIITVVAVKPMRRVRTVSVTHVFAFVLVAYAYIQSTRR